MNSVSDDPTTTPHPKRIATALRCSPEARISTFSWIQHASQEAARVLIPPAPCPCSLVPSVTTPLYSTTVSQPLRADTLEECLPAPATHEDEGAPENVEVGDTSVLTRFTANREYTSITFSERRGCILRASPTLLMVEGFRNVTRDSRASSLTCLQTP
jgi:hypothetical protein